MRCCCRAAGGRGCSTCSRGTNERMRGALQRLEVLLVGLVLVCARVVVAVLLVLRPPAPTVYLQTTPQPIAGVAAEPTQVPIATPAASSAPLVSAPPQTPDAPL